MKAQTKEILVYAMLIAAALFAVIKVTDCAKFTQCSGTACRVALGYEACPRPVCECECDVPVYRTGPKGGCIKADDNTYRLYFDQDLH